jgi:hypothetical protein
MRMGRFSRGRTSPQVWVRSHHWGPVVIAVRGRLDWQGVESLNGSLREHQEERDVVLDVWNVTRCEPAALVAIVQAAMVRAEENERGFALVGEPSWTCMQAIEANPATRSLVHCRDTHAACVALRRVTA